MDPWPTETRAAHHITCLSLLEPNKKKVAGCPRQQVSLVLAVGTSGLGCMTTSQSQADPPSAKVAPVAWAHHISCLVWSQTKKSGWLPPSTGVWFLLLGLWAELTGPRPSPRPTLPPPRLHLLHGRITSPVSFGAKLKGWLVAPVNRCLVVALGTLSRLGCRTTSQSQSQADPPSSKVAPVAWAHHIICLVWSQTKKAAGCPRQQVSGCCCWDQWAWLHDHVPVPVPGRPSLRQGCTCYMGASHHLSQSFGAKQKRWLVALVNRCLVLAFGTLSGLG